MRLFTFYNDWIDCGEPFFKVYYFVAVLGSNECDYDVTEFDNNHNKTIEDYNEIGNSKRSS